MTRISIARGTEQHMPGMKALQPLNRLVLSDSMPGVCCSAQTKFCNGQHQRWLENRTLETNPHTLALFIHGGRYGRLHDWKTGFTRSGCDHGSCRYFDVVCRGIHGCEDPGEFTAFLSADGRWQATVDHDQYPYGKASFQTSHAGKEMTLPQDTFGRSMGAPDLSGRSDCGLAPALGAGRREFTTRSKRT